MTRKKVKLPRSHGGVKLGKHPVLLAVEIAEARKMKRTERAKQMGVSPQGMLGFESRARANRDYLLPAEYVSHFSRLSGLPPCVFRPDVFLPGWNYDDGSSLAAKVVEASP